MHRRKPYEVQTPRGTVHICQCGLSKNFPICDSSHKTCVNEQDDKLYYYGEGGQREVQEP